MSLRSPTSNFRIIAVSPQSTGWHGRHLDAIVSGGQPLFMFGDRAGVMNVASTARTGMPRSTSPTAGVPRPRP